MKWKETTVSDEDVIDVIDTRMQLSSQVCLSTCYPPRVWPRLQNNRLLLHDFGSNCFDHLWSRLHVSDKLWGPTEMLQVLRRLGEGGQKSGLWKILLRWWREEAGCDGGTSWFPSSIIIDDQYVFIRMFHGYSEYDNSKMKSCNRCRIAAQLPTWTTRPLTWTPTRLTTTTTCETVTTKTMWGSALNFTVLSIIVKLNMEYGIHRCFWHV